MNHKVYKAIIEEIKAGRLAEPFTVYDFQMSCPGLGNGTYNAFLYKHRRNNLGGNSELFDKVAPGQFTCLRPFKYGLVESRMKNPMDRPTERGEKAGPCPKCGYPEVVARKSRKTGELYFGCARPKQGKNRGCNFKGCRSH